MTTPGQALREKAELDWLRRARAEAAKLHYPKGTAAGVRCATCAEWNGYGQRLRRAAWPCATATLFRLER